MLPPLRGGYYGTFEPKEHYPCFQVTSPIRLLRHFAFRPVRRRGPLPHTRFKRVLRRWLLCHAEDGGLSPLSPNFQVRSVMDPCTFHPPHDFRMKLRFRSPCKTCRSHSSRFKRTAPVPGDLSLAFSCDCYRQSPDLAP
jgi:hypothetical protein